MITRNSRLFIFDFDGVLNLYEATPAYRQQYETRLKEWLSKLSNQGHILCVASSNESAAKELEKMFHMVEMEGQLSKIPMIGRILVSFPKVDWTNITFFDDCCDHVEDIRHHYDIKCICVSRKTGLKIPIE